MRLGLHRKLATNSPPALIEVKIDTVHRLFHALDPSPFTEKDLDSEAEEFIVGWADEQPARKPLELLIYLSESGGANVEQRVQQAIQHYFAYQRDATGRRLRRLIAQGWLSLAIGVVFLALCLGAADLLFRFGTDRYSRSATTASSSPDGSRCRGHWRSSSTSGGPSVDNSACLTD